MSGVEKVTVAAVEDGMRLDRWFRLHYPTLPHGRLERLLRKGQVRVDGGRAKAGLRLVPGQSIRVPPIEQAPKWEPRTRDISDEDRAFIQSLVLYSDDHVFALNKPAGLPVQGGSRAERHLDGLLDGLEHGRGERPRLVHRLDKDTSGILILARSRADAAALGRALKQKTFRKVYWALVIGVPRLERGEIALPLIKKAGAGGERARIAEEGEEGALDALTRYRIIEPAGQRLCWLALSPITGRTHQLRAHMAAVGHPIVGDGKYGGSDAHPGGEIPSQLHLHARAVTLPRGSGGPLRLTAPLPEHMRRTWALLGLDPDYRDDMLDAWD